MTDRELLELAAKAAGLKIIKWGDPDYYSHRGGEVAYVCATGQNDPWGDEWNPLEDDGDALQLAVRLKLNVNVEHTSIDVYDQNLQLTRVWATEIDDAYAATRRAIVRAAAEIGRAM